MTNVVLGETILRVVEWVACGLGYFAIQYWLTHKSQIDQWCMKRPRLAALLKLVRGCLPDSVLIRQAYVLAIKGRLPKELIDQTLPRVDYSKVTFHPAVRDQLQSGFLERAIYDARLPPIPPPDK